MLMGGGTWEQTNGNSLRKGRGKSQMENTVSWNQSCESPRLLREGANSHVLGMKLWSLWLSFTRCNKQKNKTFNKQKNKIYAV